MGTEVTASLFFPSSTPCRTSGQRSGYSAAGKGFANPNNSLARRIPSRFMVLISVSSPLARSASVSKASTASRPSAVFTALPGRPAAKHRQLCIHPAFPVLPDHFAHLAAHLWVLHQGIVLGGTLLRRHPRRLALHHFVKTTNLVDPGSGPRYRASPRSPGGSFRPAAPS